MVARAAQVETHAFSLVGSWTLSVSVTSLVAVLSPDHDLQGES